MVQWPLLCTRGANSLSSSGSGPSADVEHLDADHADVAERVGELAGDLAGARLMRRR